MSEDYSSTRFYKVVSHENNGNQTVQYAAWGSGAAVLFVLGNLPANGYVDSDPNAPPDETSPRPVTILYLWKGIKHQDDIRVHLENVLNFEFMDELTNRPPIGDVDLSKYPADQLLLAGLFA